MDHKVKLHLHMRERSYAIRGIRSGLFAGATWGLEGVLMGMVFGLAPFNSNMNLFAAPLAGACLHDGFATLWLFVHNLIQGKWRDYMRTLKTKPGKMILAAAVLGGPVGMSGNLLAIYYSGASYTAAITSSYPAIGAVLGVFFLKERISARVWTGIILAVVGSVVVGFVPPEGPGYPHFYLGIGFAAFAAVGWALEGVISTYGMDLVDSDIAIGIREAASFLIYTIAVLPFFGLEGYRIIYESIITKSGWYVAGIAIVGGASFLSWYRSMNMTGVSRAMGLNVTFAIWSVIFGGLINHLKITPNLILGALIIFFGTILTIGNPKDMANLRKRSGGFHASDSCEI